jgi:mannose-1-phosphate guanylyltransferase / mannose-6-phosphate isomerase
LQQHISWISNTMQQRLATKSTTIHPLILSGGSGKRLWPLSRQANPKQFLKVLGDHSLFQETCLRLQSSQFGKPIIIANDSHRFLVAEQLREMGLSAKSIVLEPVGRNTAPAAVIGALLAARDDIDRLILLLPSDHAISDPKAFCEAIASGIPAAQTGSIVTFGVKPDRPHTGYGYIEVDPQAPKGETALNVSRFVEKPDAKHAAEYLKKGNFYWNAGIFLFSARTMLEAAERLAPGIMTACAEAIAQGARDLDFLRLSEKHFEKAESISIDYAIIEKATNIRCVPLGAGWSDLGSWTEVWETANRDSEGNAARGDVHFLKTADSFAYSDSAAVSVVGLKDVVVVATRDAVLVTSKAEAQSVKTVVEKFERAGREEVINHQKVHRPWGWYERLALGDRFHVKCIMVSPGATLSLQSHFHRSEHWVVVKGAIEVTKDDEVIMLSENQSTFVPVGSKHRMKNPGKIPAFLIEVQSGSYLGEDDIVRYEDVYGRAPK